MPEAAPSVVMDQHGNYWRVYPKGTLLGVDEDMWSMCPVSQGNDDTVPIAVYRQGRDLSAKDAHDLLAKIESATDDLLLLRAARGALQAWVIGRDAITEAEIMLRMIEAQVIAPARVQSP